jgi:hypothetical protein
MFEIARQIISEPLENLSDSEKLQKNQAGDLTRDARGNHTAFSDSSGMVATIREAGGGSGRMFLRRAVKYPPNDAPPRHINILVLELDGVRVYIDEDTRTVVMTKEDLYP